MKLNFSVFRIITALSIIVPGEDLWREFVRLLYTVFYPRHVNFLLNENDMVMACKEIRHFLLEGRGDLGKYYFLQELLNNEVEGASCILGQTPEGHCCVILQMEHGLTLRFSAWLDREYLQCLLSVGDDDPELGLDLHAAFTEAIKQHGFEKALRVISVMTTGPLFIQCGNRHTRPRGEQDVLPFTPDLSELLGDRLAPAKRWRAWNPPYVIQPRIGEDIVILRGKGRDTLRIPMTTEEAARGFTRQDTIFARLMGTDICLSLMPNYDSNNYRLTAHEDGSVGNEPDPEEDDDWSY